MCLCDCVQTHGIVQAGFDVSGSVRSCTVIVADTDGNRFRAAFEIRSNRGTEQTELIFVCRAYTDDSAASINIWTDVYGRS